MILRLRVVALIVGLGVLAMCIWQLRKRDQTPATRRSFQTTMILVAAVFAGTLPSLLAPLKDWLLMTGAIMSMALTVVAVILIRRPLSSKTIYDEES